MPTRLLMPLAEGFEETEAIATLDLLRRAEFDVATVGIGGTIIQGGHGISVMADMDIVTSSFNPAELEGIVVPGGIPGVNNLAADSILMNLIKQVSANGGLIAAICAAPAVVLQPAGLTQGRQVTGYPSTEDLFENATYHATPVVIDGNLITSRGVGTAIDFGLAIVEYFTDKTTAIELAKSVVHTVA